MAANDLVLGKETMSNIAILFRNTMAINRFQEAIIAAIGYQHFNKAILSSGFFQEGRGNYSASGTLMHSAFYKRTTPLHLTAVGVYDSRWLAAFDQFVNQIKSNTSPACITIEKRKTLRLRWHAKVFIAWEGASPAFAVIGSSNMTRPAFDTSKPFNYESDVVIWDTSFLHASTLGNSLFRENNGDFDVVYANYEEGGRNGDVTVSQRLKRLAEIILGSSTLID